MEEELSPIDIVQHKIQLLPSLKGVVEAHQERVSYILEQNVSFRHDVLDLISSDDGLLLQHFDGIALPSALVSTEVHLHGRSSAEREVIYMYNYT